MVMSFNAPASFFRWGYMRPQCEGTETGSGRGAFGSGFGGSHMRSDCSGIAGNHDFAWGELKLAGSTTSPLCGFGRKWLWTLFFFQPKK